MAVMLVLAAAVVAGAVAVLAMGLGAEAVPAVAGVPATVRVGAAEAVPAMGRAGVVAVDGVTIIAAMVGAAMAVTLVAVGGMIAGAAGGTSVCPRLTATIDGYPRRETGGVFCRWLVSGKRCNMGSEVPMSIRKRSWKTSKGEPKEAWVVDYVDSGWPGAT